MDISVLGPLQVTIAGRDVPIPAKQAVLLAILAIQPNREVSTDRLIEALWGEDAPSASARTLQTHVFQLRRRLEAAQPVADPGATDKTPGQILTRGAAYRLAIDERRTDAHRFEALVESSRSSASGDPRAAIAMLTQAVAIWRGPGVADVGDEPVATAELARLEELRASSIDQLVTLRLELGEHEALTAELRRAVGESPYRERLWASLMLALARSGRRAEALLAYRDAEVALRRELDVEPGPELQALAARIRAGESGPPVPRLATTARAATSDRADRLLPSPDPAARRAPRWRRLAATAVVVAVVGVTVMIGGVGAGIGRSEPSSPPSGSPVPIPVVALAADSVGVVDRDGRIVSSMRVGTQPDGIALAAGDLWIANTSDGTVTRVDPVDGRTVQVVAVGESPTAVAAGFGSVWVANSGDGSVSRINPAVNRIVDRIAVGIGPYGIATDDRWVWVTNRLDGTLSRIDPEHDHPTTFAVGETPLGVAAAGGKVWVADFERGAVVRVDPATGGIVDSIPVGKGPSAIAARGDQVWVTDTRAGTVSRIDPVSEIVKPVVDVGQDPGGLAIADDAVWVAVASPPSLVRVDLASGAAKQHLLAGSPRSVLLQGDDQVVTIRGVPGAHRGGTLRVVSGPYAFPNSPDPAYGQAWTGNLTLLTNDGLLGYARVGGPDGETIVEDLAAAIPTPSDGGRTYRFQLRPGIRFSTGDPVRARDVARSIERARVAPGGAWGLASIVGAGTCSFAAPCDLSHSVVADDASGTVTVHLTAPDPYFLYALAMPAAAIVPASTPLGEQTAPLPATGPYMYDRFGPTSGVRLVRNPAFVQWSAKAQPYGYPDVIEWSEVDRSSDPSIQVERGNADWAADELPTDRILHLATTLPGQLHVESSTKTFFVAMNPSKAPFDDPRVRQAVLLATDRAAALRSYGGPTTGRITCQVLPPTFPGYSPYCPSTVAPDSTGTWHGPDTQAARALIEAAGATGAKVTIYAADGPGHRDVAAYVASMLRGLGLDATTSLVDPDVFFAEGGPLSHPSDIQVAAYWVLATDTTAADQFVGIFTCPDYPAPAYAPVYPATLCDRSIDGMVSKAQDLETAGNRPGANAAWAEIDRRVTDSNVVDPLFNPTDVAFVSARVGNVQHHPIWQVLLDQMWVQ